MRRKRISAHALAIELCRRENMSYKKVHEHSCELLERYAKGQSDPLRWNKFRKKTFGSIQQEKQNIRRRYIEIIKGKKPYSDEEYEDFVWDVVTSRWFLEKATMILDLIELLVDGSVSGTDYDVDLDARNQGKQIRRILKDLFLRGENNVKDGKAIYVGMGISRATYFRRRPDGIVLFGILMWIYAKRREEEDIEAGIVDRPEEDIIDMPISEEFIFV